MADMSSSFPSCVSMETEPTKPGSIHSNEELTIRARSNGGVPMWKVWRRIV